MYIEFFLANHYHISLEIRCLSNGIAVYKLIAKFLLLKDFIDVLVGYKV